MKNSLFLSLILFVTSALGGSALLLLQNTSTPLQRAPQASQDIQFNWGEGSEVKWSEDSTPKQRGETPNQVASN
jgi:hypothetical protein